MSRPSSSKYNWQKPQTRFYENNYGFGSSFYRPMIDYIEKRAKGVHARHPLLPRDLEHYSRSRKLVQSYSDPDLARLSERASVRRDLREYRFSGFELSKSVSAASLTDKVKIEKGRRKKQDLCRQISKVRSKMADALDYDPDLDREVERELKGMQRHLRGKSAKCIEDQLLSKSRKKIAEHIESDLSMGQQVNIKRRVKIINRSVSDCVDENITQPLSQLSTDLQGFSRKTTDFFYDKR
ncbi:paramyosin, short form-like [Photinus pyralis]|uniref:paramyosin, short form-like n=1 Tax=Photinus pyralis TaxID=7054 RepID=UPI0012676FD4|nr:paramyosin, short form-like [Photinus pyralis]